MCSAESSTAEKSFATFVSTVQQPWVGAGVLHFFLVVMFVTSCMQGACFDLRDEFGKTPLHFAAAAGKTATVRLLLDNGADPNALDREGHTSLHMAALQVLCSPTTND